MGNSFEIKKNVYWTGVVDRDLKIFDIIMETEFGSTYNSYLIKDEKTVLFDTVKGTFKDDFFNNLKDLTDISKIDYVVIHHTEPDHSGCLKYILEENPEIEVYCTNGAKAYLNHQLNKPFKCHVIKDGETLNIGKRNIKFITAPFLHWADTMFSYVEEDQILLTCDAFGCHFSNTDPEVVTTDDYKKALKYYFDCIVKPFSKFVITAIDKVIDQGLKFDTILTSHGPILSKNPGEIIELYYNWAKENVNFVNQDKAAVFYLSAYDNTRRMAETIVETMNTEGAKTTLYDLETTNLTELYEALLSSKVILLGSPTINKSMVKPMWDLFSILDPVINQGKIAGVFGSFGWSGEGISMAQALLKAMYFKVPVEPLKKSFVPSDETLEDCIQFGKEFAKLIK